MHFVKIKESERGDIEKKEIVTNTILITSKNNSNQV